MEKYYEFFELELSAQIRAAKDYIESMDDDILEEYYEGIEDRIEYTMDLLLGSDYVYNKAGKYLFNKENINKENFI